MDVVPLPERKKPSFLRATKEQIDILIAGFVVSDISSKHHLAALSEATGLPPKWIASWFTRQRKKVAVASKCIKNQTKTTERAGGHEDTTTATAMSIQEIADFKTEHVELTLSDSLVPPVDSELEQKPVPSQKSTNKTARKSTKKRTSDSTPYPHMHPTSPLKPPFICAPLASRSGPSSSEQHLFEAQPQPADRASPTSTFILREMVPVIYKPKTPNQNDLIHPSTITIDSQPFEAFSPCPSARRPTLATVSNAIASDSKTSLSTDHNSKMLSAETAGPRLGCVYPWQDSNPIESPQGGSKDHKTTSQKPQGLNRSNTPNPHPSFSAQPKFVPRIDRPLRPLLPLDWNTVPASHLFHYSQAPFGTPQAQGDRNSKENQPMYPQIARHASSKLRSAGPRNLPPLFTTTNLEITRARRLIQSTTSDDGAIPTSIATWIQTSQQHSFVPNMTGLPELSPVGQNENETRFDDQTSSLFDSTTAPLKYLDVLRPFPDESLSMDEMMSRLLDPQLAEEDPFQAAMGLVFASQLGLNWDYAS
ncbi:hypothetical protein C0989_011970 [Termitomyces sp. Mn162]|nr:hypothetical protein C0989_011970 [Termitomyces sp. Mn162]